MEAAQRPKLASKSLNEHNRKMQDLIIRDRVGKSQTPFLFLVLLDFPASVIESDIEHPSMLLVHPPCGRLGLKKACSTTTGRDSIRSAARAAETGSPPPSPPVFANLILLRRKKV